MTLDALDVVILCGGRGTRLASVINDRPKPLAPLGGVPFLDLLMHRLARQLPAHRIVLACGHMAEQIIARYGERPQVLISREQEPLGTGGAVGLASRSFGIETALVLNGDTFINLDYRPLVEAFRAQRAELTMVASPVEDTARFGSLAIAGDRLVGFREKQASAGPGLVNAGVYMLGTQALGMIPGGVSSLENDLFPALVSGGKTHVHVVTSSFIDIGTPESYREAETALAGEIASLTAAGAGGGTGI